MQVVKLKRASEEALIEAEIMELLQKNGWKVDKIVGNMHQQGLPDLLACHPNYKTRFIEVKKPGMKGSSFTAAQLREFPMWYKFGMPLYIITAATDEEYRKLFQPPNVMQYITPYIIRAAGSTSERISSSIDPFISGPKAYKLSPDLIRCCRVLPSVHQNGKFFHLECPVCHHRSKESVDSLLVAEMLWDASFA